LKFSFAIRFVCNRLHSFKWLEIHDLTAMTDNVTTELDIEDSPIVTVFNRPAAAKILTVLNDGAGLPLPASDIAEQANVARKSVYNNLEMLETYGFIEEDDDGWRAIMDSETMQAFMYLRDSLIDAEN